MGNDLFRRDTQTSSHDEKRTYLLETALELLHSGGSDAFGMRAVARMAGVSLRTVQHYFPTKQALFASAISRLLQRFRKDGRPVRELVAEKRHQEALECWAESCLQEGVLGIKGELFSEALNIARHDSDTKLALFELHKSEIEFATWLFQQCNGNLQDQVAHQRAVTAYALLSGLQPMVFLGLYKDSALEDICRNTVSQVVRLAMD